MKGEQNYFGRIKGVFQRMPPTVCRLALSAQLYKLDFKRGPASNSPISPRFCALGPLAPLRR